MITEDSIVVATDRQVSRAFLDDEAVILDVQEGSYYVLNPVGARVWGIIQSPRAVRDIIEVLLQEYDVPRDQCVREVVELLNSLAERQLIETKDGPP